MYDQILNDKLQQITNVPLYEMLFIYFKVIPSLSDSHTYFF